MLAFLKQLFNVLFAHPRMLTNAKQVGRETFFGRHRYFMFFLNQLFKLIRVHETDKFIPNYFFSFRNYNFSLVGYLILLLTLFLFFAFWSMDCAVVQILMKLSFFDSIQFGIFSGVSGGMEAPAVMGVVVWPMNKMCLPLILKNC